MSATEFGVDAIRTRRRSVTADLFGHDLLTGIRKLDSVRDAESDLSSAALIALYRQLLASVEEKYHT